MRIVTRGIVWNIIKMLVADVVNGTFRGGWVMCHLGDTASFVSVISKMGFGD
jgi:hypothetical protein